LPGGYHLLAGRESARFQSLVDLFWYGIAGAMAIVVALGVAIGWLIRRALLSEVHEISRTAAAIASGDLSQRVVTRGGSDELDTLAQTVNDMLEQLASQNAQLEGEVAVRTQAEQALHQAHDDLEGLVLQRTTQLAQANTSLEGAFKETQNLKEQFELAIDTIPGLVWSSCPDGHIDFLNQRWREYTGLTLAQATGWGWQVAIHPDDLAGLVYYWKAVLTSGEPGETIARLRRFDGEYRWFLFRGVPLYDESGKLLKWYGTNTDIEDRKRAEALLEGEKRLLEMIARRNPLPVTLAAVCRLFEEACGGVFCSILLLDPKNGRLWHAAGPSLPRSYIEAVDGCALTDGPCGMAATLAQPVIACDIGSDERWCEYRTVHAEHGLRACWSTPIMSSDGKVLGTFAILSREPGTPTPHHQNTIESMTDIASIAIERTRAEEELQRQKAHLDELFELAPDAIVLTDLNQPRIIRVNKEFTRMFGYTPDEAVGRRLRSLIAPEEQRADGGPQDPDLLAGKKVDREVLRQRKDGTRFHAQVTAARVQLRDEEAAAYLIFRDITGRKAAEDNLRRSEAFLAEGQRISHTGGWAWVLSTGKVIWSDEQCRMLGFEPHEVTPSIDVFLGAVHPEDRSRVRRGLEEATSHRRNYAMEYRVVLPGGSIRHLSSVGRPVVGESGDVDEYIGVSTDITERVQADAALKRSERQLRQSQRLEAMGTLAGGIAHDFNNILGAILGYGEMAQRDAPKGGRLRRDLDSIVSAGERGRALVDRILTFSRSGVSEKISVPVEKVVREALDLLSPTLPAGVRVEAHLRAGRAAMLGDPTQVHQVLMNLATNAVHAMGAGGTLRVSLDAVRVDAPRAATIGTICTQDYIVLAVADTGDGIAPDVLERMFDPFFTTKDVSVGTGLGLSLVHGIVTEVGGAIDVASALGAGSVFTVYLPRTGAVAEDLADEQPGMPRGNRQRVLVIDDEEPLVRLATETLQELGYAPVGFTSSAAALDAFRAEPNEYAAVITDERMPGMSGSTLIREMRDIRRSIPILLVSGYVGGMVLGRAYNAGASEVLKKPLSAHELATSLARVLQAQPRHCTPQT
jgi:PAS domain S-box-containing protein